MSSTCSMDQLLVLAYCLLSFLKKQKTMRRKKFVQLKRKKLKIIFTHEPIPSLQFSLYVLDKNWNSWLNFVRKANKEKVCYNFLFFSLLAVLECLWSLLLRENSFECEDNCKVKKMGEQKNQKIFRFSPKEWAFRNDDPFSRSVGLKFRRIFELYTHFLWVWF